MKTRSNRLSKIEIVLRGDEGSRVYILWFFLPCSSKLPLPSILRLLSSSPIVSPLDPLLNHQFYTLKLYPASCFPPIRLGTSSQSEAFVQAFSGGSYATRNASSAEAGAYTVLQRRKSYEPVGLSSNGEGPMVTTTVSLGHHLCRVPSKFNDPASFPSDRKGRVVTATGALDHHAFQLFSGSSNPIKPS